MTTTREKYAGQETVWIGEAGARVRFLERSPGLVVVEKGVSSVTLTLEEARAMGLVVQQGPLTHAR